MKKVRVMLASRPKMLSEVIGNMVARQADMVLVGQVLDPIELLFATKATPVDVVIVTPLGSDGEPKICRHLLAEHPLLKIVTLSTKGEAAFLYESGSRKKRIGEATEPQILSAIRQALSRNPM